MTQVKNVSIESVGIKRQTNNKYMFWVTSTTGFIFFFSHQMGIQRCDPIFIFVYLLYQSILSMHLLVEITPVTKTRDNSKIIY